MPTIYPAIRYNDARAAIEFLTTALGFVTHAVHESEDGKIAHAELRHGDGMIMLGERRSDDDDRFDTGRVVTYVVVDDPDAVHDHAKSAGAEIVFELTDQPYGSRDFAAADPEGNIWSFGTYNPIG
jgi:uncharacterized glyoxalase superfamily protein PhnB